MRGGVRRKKNRDFCDFSAKMSEKMKSDSFSIKIKHKKMRLFAIPRILSLSLQASSLNPQLYGARSHEVRLYSTFSARSARFSLNKTVFVLSKKTMFFISPGPPCGHSFFIFLTVVFLLFFAVFKKTKNANYAPPPPYMARPTGSRPPHFVL